MYSKPPFILQEVHHNYCTHNLHLWWAKNQMEDWHIYQQHFKHVELLPVATSTMILLPAEKKGVMNTKNMS